MNQFYDMFVGPLGVEYCNLYFGIIVLNLVFAVVSLMLGVRHVVMSKKIGITEVFMGIYGIFILCLNNVMTRLMYSICVKAL